MDTFNRYESLLIQDLKQKFIYAIYDKSNISMETFVINVEFEDKSVTHRVISLSALLKTFAASNMGLENLNVAIYTPNAFTKFPEEQFTALKRGLRLLPPAVLELKYIYRGIVITRTNPLSSIHNS
uniref:Uncharacterized protein n=1 Tax=Glossina pallidipes TaxID=7398 RepID=A0A1B0ADS3_GLOPL